MNSHYVDEKGMFESVDVIIKDVESIDSCVIDIRNDIDRVKELCVQLKKYDRSLVDINDLIYDFEDTSLNQMYCWMISGEDKIEGYMGTLEFDLNELDERIYSFKHYIKTLSDRAFETGLYAKKIESIFLDSSSDDVSYNDNNSENPSFSKEQVLASIENQFKNNRDLNQQFNNEVSRGVYDRFIQFSSNEMGKSHGTR